jgi:hypothetical protein
LHPEAYDRESLAVFPFAALESARQWAEEASILPALMTPFTIQEPGEITWRELSPGVHVVEFYKDESALVDSLAAFISAGICRDEVVIVIATDAHRRAVNRRLAEQNINLTMAAAMDRYIEGDAEQTLSRFMAAGLPDETRFRQTVREFLLRARATGRPIRVFGEMVALLWARGNCEATMRLEELWGDYCQSAGLRLFCAYPRACFTDNGENSIRNICSAHSRVLGKRGVLPSELLNRAGRTDLI